MNFETLGRNTGSKHRDFPSQKQSPMIRSKYNRDGRHSKKTARIQHDNNKILAASSFVEQQLAHDFKKAIACWQDWKAEGCGAENRCIDGGGSVHSDQQDGKREIFRSATTKRAKFSQWKETNLSRAFSLNARSHVQLVRQRLKAHNR